MVLLGLLPAAASSPLLRRAATPSTAEALLRRRPLAAPGGLLPVGPRAGPSSSRRSPRIPALQRVTWSQRRCCGTSAEQQSALDRLSKAAADPQALQDFLAKAPPEVRGVVATEAFRALSDKSVAHDVEAFMAGLTSEEARVLGVAALSRHFGSDFQSELKAADNDRSGSLDRVEFKRYLCKVATRFCPDVEKPTSRQVMLFALNSAIPFVVFGALDNSIMILGGDVVDDLIGHTFQLSTLACAALANTFADVLGISIGNSVEALTARMGLPQANLTAAQAELPAVRRIGLASGSFGILIGCLIGMAPLLFMDQDKKALKEMFTKTDTAHEGSLEVPRLVRVLERAGYEEVTEAKLRTLVQELGIVKDGRVSMKDFLDHSKRFAVAFR